MLLRPKDSLCAIAMMDIEIDDRDPLSSMTSARIERRDRDIRKEAKAHRAIGLGIVPRRTDLTKGVSGSRVRIHNGVDRQQAGAEASECGLPRAARHDRIAIERIGKMRPVTRDRAYPLKIITAMSPQNRRFGVIPEWRVTANQSFESRIFERLIDCPHARRALNVEGAGIVAGEARMRDE